MEIIIMTVMWMLRGQERSRKIQNLWATLVVPWLKMHLAMQETPVRPLVQEDTHVTEQLSPCTTTTEPKCPRVTLPKRSHSNEQPMHCN